jgi:hypothetical protein
MVLVSVMVSDLNQNSGFGGTLVAGLQRVEKGKQIEILLKDFYPQQSN